MNKYSEEFKFGNLSIVAPPPNIILIKKVDILVFKVL